MKTIKNSDIRFEINSRIVYVPSFEMKFYTVSQKEYYFKKTDADVTEAEVSGETKYYLDLDWSQLKYLGKGVLNYQCVNNIADPSFPDGEYNQLIEKTTDYFIDTFTVNPDDDEESVIELIEKEEEERKEADDELQANIDAEESARTAADEAFSGALDTKLDVTAYTPTDLTNYYTKDETSGKTELDTAFAAKLDATAYTPTDLSNYYTKSETSGKTEIATALSGKSDTGHTHDERYYRKDETSGATELEAALDRKLDASAYTPTDLSNYYTKDETSGKSEIASAISDLSGAVDTALLGYVNNAAYVSTAKTINLLHGSTVIASIDATDFIKDGMVDNVVISGGSLVITFNTDSGKEAITIALTDIFDPSNYYTKSDVDSALSGKADTTAVTQAITEATSGKANSSDVYLKSETSGKTEIQTALEAKLDTTAYTPTDLSNYYTKGETSGATELSSAFDAKQDTLIAGDNITISGNVISATGGDMSNYYTKAEVDEMSEVAARGINDLNTNKLDVTAYTPTDLSNYYTKSETSGATELETAFNGYVTTDTEQTISGRKIFTYRDSKGKAIEFKQTFDSDKVGFSIRNSASTNNEVASFEFRPNTFTIDGVQHPLMYFGHYRTTAIGNAGVPQTVIGFRQYDQANAAAYHMLAPLPEKAKTPFSLTTNFRDFYMPMGFKNGSTMVKADETGVVDLSSIITGGTSINVVQTTGTSTTDVMSQNAVTTELSGKQETLTSGTNIKTINGNSILGSGNITIQGGSGNDVVELTQAEYDALTTKDPDTFYVITDATPADLTNYYTKSETSGKTELETAFSGKQDTLSAGTGIDITSNVISVTGGTGGKAIEAGRGISITTGETADTVSFDLPISAGTGSGSIKCGGHCVAEGWRSAAFGNNASAKGTNSFAINQSTAKGQDSFSQGNSNAERFDSAAFGRLNYSKNDCELSCGSFNNSVSASTTFGDSGNTLFSVGNGTSNNARHNAFEIRQNGDIYITSGGTDIKLQDNLGGGGSSVTVVQTTGTSTTDVMSQDAVTTALSGKADAADLGGLKLQQITQSAYDALTTKDASTLYVITDS